MNTLHEAPGLDMLFNDQIAMNRNTVHDLMLLDMNTHILLKVEVPTISLVDCLLKGDLVRVNHVCQFVWT